MELRHLRYFVAVAETLNFNKAADQLSISQPPLSQQIKDLEQELGTLLFMREKKKVSLTEAGQAFLLEAKIILSRTESAKEYMKHFGKGLSGRLKVGITEPAMLDVATEILQTFKTKHPDIEVILKDDWTEPLVRSLMSEELDIAFLHPPIANQNIKIQPINESGMLLCLPKSHPLAQKKVVAVKELANEHFLIHPRIEGPVLYDEIISLCLKAGFSPKIVQETIPQHVSIAFVAAGLGVSFVSASMQLFQHPSVKYLPLKDKTPTLKLGLAWQSGKLKPASQALLEITKAWIFYPPTV
jgi:DNA-binding transcriptional LysR family regulator